MEEKNTVKSIVKTVVRAGGLIGGGAVVGCLLRGSDLSGLKGIGKICAGIGIIGLSHAAGDAAADALDKDVDSVYDTIQFFTEEMSSDNSTDIPTVEGEVVTA